MEKFRQILIEKTGVNPLSFYFTAAPVSGMNIFNIIVGTVMLIIGGILLFAIRKQKTGGGKRVAGWILIGLGALAIVTHIYQILT